MEMPVAKINRILPERAHLFDAADVRRGSSAGLLSAPLSSRHYGGLSGARRSGLNKDYGHRTAAHRDKACRNHQQPPFARGSQR